MSTDRKTFKTRDGTILSYMESGRGRTLVLVHGWSQAAEQFHLQFDAFADRYHVIAFDQRGHGLSSRPNHGYRVSRLTMDLRELLVGLQLKDVAILGHSMGCSVVWGYLDVFGDDRISRLVLVDGPPCLTINPLWSAREAADAGALFSPAAAMDFCNALDADESGAFSDSLMGSMLTPGCPKELREWMMRCNRQMRRADAAALMRNHANIDWRDAIKRIRLPTLAVGAEGQSGTGCMHASGGPTHPGCMLGDIRRREGRQPLYVRREPREVQSRGPELSRQSTLTGATVLLCFWPPCRAPMIRLL